MRFSDKFSGGIFAAIGATLLIAGWRIPTPPMQAVGPGLYPGTIGALMLLFGLIIALRDVRSSGAWIALDDWMRDRPRIMAALALPVAIVAYVLVSELLGFIAGGMTAILIVGIAWRDRLIPAIVLAAVTSLVLFYFFGSGLRVPLPQGAVEGLLSWNR